MTLTDAAEPGLRERKRLATRRAIQFAVLELVSERGLEGVTVDEVSRRADVSARTFFNYFASKEEALLGDPPEIAAGPSVEAFVVGGSQLSLIDGLASLLTGTAENLAVDRELTLMRRDLLKRNPHLFAMRMATMRSFEEDVAAIVARRLLVDDPTLARDPEGLANRSRLVALVGFAAMRNAWTCWAAGGASVTLSDRLVESFGEMKSLFAATA